MQQYPGLYLVNNEDNMETDDQFDKMYMVEAGPRRLSPGLKIDVPQPYDNLKSSPESELGKPFSPSRSPSSVLSNVDFENVTHLPTPIMRNDSFGRFSSSPPESMLNVNVQKIRNMKRETPNSAMSGSSRVISEYKPIGIGRTSSLVDSMSRTSKRYVSNPQLSKSSPVESASFPDELIQESAYEGTTFRSKKCKAVYRFDKEIGKGSFSKVIKATNIIDNNDSVAIKIVKIPNNDKTEISNFKSFIKRELNILHNISHPSIISILDYEINLKISIPEIENSILVESESEMDNDFLTQEECQTLSMNNEQLFFLKYCKGGNLFEFLSTNYKLYNRMPIFWKLIRRITSEVIAAICYLHSNDIIHRDIKLENILLNESILELLEFSSNDFDSPITCLTDFGLSKKLKEPNQLLSTRCGSQDYISPEILMGLKYNGKLTDAWSLGVLIYSILENRLPFDLIPISPDISRVSPSVIRRRRAKNNVAHRIAMIDWDWYTVNILLDDDTLDDESRKIIVSLKELVEKLLVRKDRRATLLEIIKQDEFDWICKCLPKAFCI